jgi:hypothetical protein
LYIDGEREREREIREEKEKEKELWLTSTHRFELAGAGPRHGREERDDAVFVVDECFSEDP